MEKITQGTVEMSHERQDGHEIDEDASICVMDHLLPVCLSVNSLYRYVRGCCTRVVFVHLETYYF